MNTRQLRAGLAALAITVSGAALADGIYKWTDADGNVHYEDRPTASANAERMQISYNRTNNSVVTDRVQARRDARSARDEARQTSAADAEKTAEEELAQAEQRAEQCKSSRAQLKTMLEAQRVYQEDENGEREYLDDAAREQATEQAQQMIDEYCG